MICPTSARSTRLAGLTIRVRALARLAALSAACAAAGGCEGPLVRTTDRQIEQLIAQRQQTAIGIQRPAAIEPIEPDEALPSKQAYSYAPQPIPPEIPAGFEPQPRIETETPQPATPPAEVQPAAAQPAESESVPAETVPAEADSTTTEPSATQPPETQPTGAALMPSTQPAEMDSQEAFASAPASAPAKPERPLERYRDRLFAVTDALAYAQQHRRAFQTAREDLYLAALRLTLEKHLWTPQFSGQLRTVYGNFGEDQNFDQAMRFVAELNAAQRLPYGGQFTASAIATLIRDVGQSITASEGSAINFGLEIPFLRGAGHVAREDLIQLQRALTYAVRDFERFRREQVVLVATNYFSLLASKQSVIDAYDSLMNARADYERAAAIEQADPTGASASLPLDTRRAEQRMLSEESRYEQLRESFRFAADRFKLLIGMPVDEPLGMDDLEDIESIEQGIIAGRYPLLAPPAAADDVDRALDVAIMYRLDLLSVTDQIEDARRGVDIARNALLPDLNWNSSLTFDTDPLHYNIAAHEFDRANWRSEVILSMDDRFTERTQYRASLIDVRRAQRARTELIEQIRVDVRRAVNQLVLQTRVIVLQQRNVDVAEFRVEFARIQFEDGELSNRDLIEAQDEWVNARNALNQAKSDLWSAVLEFRLATDTLRVGDDGRQYDPPVQ